MGVKLQLLLGLLLFGSVCGLESNNTDFQNASSEKIVSSKNFIEKLPKTDSKINLVNKDTHDNSDTDSLKFSNYDVDNDTHRNITNEETENNNNDKGRQDNSRSINLERFASPDFHTNEYLSDNQKFIENSIHKSSTKGYLDFLNYQLATPETKDFDLRFEETRQKIEQEYEENNPEHLDEDHLHEHHSDEDPEIDHKDISHDLHIDRLFGNSKLNPNASLDYKERTKILKNNTVDDNSEHNRFSVVKVQKLNFASEYNVSTLDEDDTGKVESTPIREKIEITPSRGFLTTRKPITLTKPPTSHSNHILNNKIESETIKAINSLTTEYSAAKRLNGENEIIPKEQNVDENKISIQTTNSETVLTEYSTTTTEKVPTTEQIRETTININKNVFTTTTEQLEVSTVNTITTEQETSTNDIKHEDHTTTNIEDTNEIVKESTTLNNDVTTEKNSEISTSTNNYMDDVKTTSTNEVELTTVEATTEETTTEYKELKTISTTLLRDETTIESSTVTPTTEDVTITTIFSKMLEETTNVPTEDTTKVTTDDITRVTAEDTTKGTEDTTKVTTQDNTKVTTQDTTNQTTQEFVDSITTEYSGRVSKAFSFEDTTLTTTETISSKLFSVSETQVDEKTDVYTTIKNGTDVDSTTLDSKTEVETSTEALPTSKSTEMQTSTSTTNETPTTKIKLTTLSPLKENISTINYINVKTNENNTTPSTETSSSSSNSIPSVTDLPNIRNMSTTEGVTVITTSSTEDYTDTSSVPDPGNIGGIEDNKGKIAAIVISAVGAVSLILLAGLLYIMRKRQKRFNYKQRCRPVSLDHYSVDNVSGYNSTRRKAERQSKRSYGNPAFDDPVALTHPLNLPALAKFATNTEDIKAEFEEIPQITAKISELPDGCETKNRYANVIPLPETRVFLQPIDGYPNSDYINANYVTGPKNTKGYYIACQAPMQNTVDDFWRMVWEQQSKVILMITHLFENGVEKCADYLPPSEVLDCNRLFGDFQVTLKKRDVKDKYIISNLQLKNMVSNSWREVTHFWYLGWPEKGVPSEENSLIAFLIEARSYMKSSTLDKIAAANGNMNGPPKNEVNPVVVHCSPGTGRTGVVIACDIAIREFEQTRLVDIPKIVYRIRRDRASAVQTKEQYMLIYKVVSLYATKLTGGALESF